MDEKEKKIQKGRRIYLLELMTSASGGQIDIETYKFNRVFLVFGFTGSGKDTVIDGFLAQNKKYPFSKFVRTLTRPIRPNENETVSGYFIEKDLFEHLMKRSRFFYHYEKYDGDEFGYDSVHLIFLLSRGNVIIIGGGEQNLEGLVSGIKGVFEAIPITTVFVNRNKEDIIEGMKKRGGSPEQIRKRTESIQKNWAPKPQHKFDCIIWNDNLEQSIKEFSDLVESSLNNQPAK
jgi:guanylate kinase